MAKPLAQVIADRFIGQQVNILRLAVSERDRVFTMLGGLQARILQKMDQQIPLPGFGSFTQQKLGALYRLTDKLIEQQYGQVSGRHQQTLIDVSQFQGAQTKKIINAVIGVPLLTVGVPLVTLKALVSDDLVDGRPAKYWWAQQASTLKSRYRDEVRMGAFAGETLGQLKQRVRGTKAANYQDGLMAISGRQAEALIRTSLLSVANAARAETYQANDDVLDGHQWLSTLDDRTCEVCMALDGQAWDFDGDPQEGTTQAYPGPPPQHFNCRCTLVPTLKSWEQLQAEAGNEETTLGRKLDELKPQLNPGMRASMGGSVSARLTYDEWLRTQPVEVQQEVLGAKRAALWQRGLIKAQDLVDQQNRPLTLPTILKNAGLEPPEPVITPPLVPPTPPTEPKASVSLTEKAIAPFVRPAPLTMNPTEVVSLTRNTATASNGSWVVTYKNKSRAIYKPTNEESDHLRVGIEVGTYYQREVVAYEVAKLLKMDDLVPKTVVQTYEKGIGSVQAFAERSKTAKHLDNSMKYGTSHHDVERATLFDAIMGNSDRHAANWMITSAGKMVLIDHGLILSKLPSYPRIDIRNGLTDRRAEIPASIKAPWKAQWPKIKMTLKKQGIEPEAIKLAQARFEYFMKPGSTWRQIEERIFLD